MPIAALLLIPILTQDPPLIRAEVRLVNLTIAATDAASGRLIADLSRDEFEILEDGVPQKIEFFNRSADVALSLAIVMDGSGSQEKFVKRHRRDIRTFLRATLRSKDRAMLTGFGNRIRLIKEFTQDADDLLDAAEDYGGKQARNMPEIGPAVKRDLGSGVYDGIFHTMREGLAKVEAGRKALLLFSDGEDNASANHMLDVLEAAQKLDIVIYGIHYLESKNQNARNIYGRRVMERLARDTGGESFEATDDLKAAFSKIGDQLRSSYQAAYRSSNLDKPGSFRNITIRVTRPGVRLRHRTGYFVDDPR